MNSRIRTFEDLVVWQKVIAFVKQVSLITDEGGLKRDFGLIDQLRRALPRFSKVTLKHNYCSAKLIRQVIRFDHGQSLHCTAVTWNVANESGVRFLLKNTRNTRPAIAPGLFSLSFKARVRKLLIKTSARIKMREQDLIGYDVCMIDSFGFNNSA
jgi:hypothetical protein